MRVRIGECEGESREKERMGYTSTDDGLSWVVVLKKMGLRKERTIAQCARGRAGWRKKERGRGEEREGMVGWMEGK